MATTLSKQNLPGAVRLFIAVELPPPISEAVASVAQRLSGFHHELKLVRPDLIHITVRFLGSTPGPRVAGVESAVQEAAGRVSPFRLHLSHVGTFPGGNKPPRVVWVGLRHDDGYARLEDMFERLETALAARGFDREKRRFAPHLTVARVRDDAQPAAVRRLGEAVRALPPDANVHGSFEVREVTVNCSDLSPSGPRYTPLARVPLGSKEEDTAP